jgi:hypothetical protein
VALGTISASWEQAKGHFERGYQMVTLCSDASLVWRGALKLATRFRQAFPGESSSANDANQRQSGGGDGSFLGFLADG